MASVHQRGGRRYLALTNDNAYFHMREDRFANNVDVSLVAQYAEAFSGSPQPCWSLALPAIDVIDLNVVGS